MKTNKVAIGLFKSSITFMAITRDQVAAIFESLGNGNADDFFKHVDDHVKWSVLGTHPLAENYYSKTNFQKATFAMLSSIMREGIPLHAEHIWVDDQTAIVELSAHSITKKGTPFNNLYCWVCHFFNDKIVEVRACLDSALVKQVIEEADE